MKNKRIIPMRNKDKIIIQDWTGRILFEGSYKNKEVDKVLEANYCDCKKNNMPE
jgi:hypothetical protein